MLKAAIIGCGGISQVHGWAINNIKNAELSLVCDIDYDKAKCLSEKYTEGCAKVTTDWYELCDSDIDVVHICTPHYLHVPMALELLRHEKAVFMEKPCAISAGEFMQLKTEESNEILRRIKAGDENLKDYYVYCNMRLVLSIVQKFSVPNENVDDIFQVGCVGLLKAIDNFDISQNVQFSTYAVPMIIGEIKRYIRDSSIMRVTRSLRDTAYLVLKSKEKLERENGDVRLEDIASDLNLTIREVYDAIDSVSSPLSLDDAIKNDLDEDLKLGDKIEDKEHSVEKWVNHTDLNDAISALDNRERQILNLRYFVGKTQMEVSDEVGISQAQVSRLEKNALDHIKKCL